MRVYEMRRFADSAPQGDQTRVPIDRLLSEHYQLAVDSLERHSVMTKRARSHLYMSISLGLIVIIALTAIVHAFGLDERTVARWRDRAGMHCERMHHALVEQGKLDLVQVQADEIRVKGHGRIVWMGLAMMVPTRLWLAGVVSATRDRALADRLMGQVRACAQRLCALLVCTDGWAAYPNSIRRAFREKVKTTAGRGRACLQVWPELHIGMVIKHTVKHHVTHITRQMAHGVLERASALLTASRGGTVLNVAFIERFNGTMRERLACLTRKCRHAAHRLAALHTGMYLLGCIYNFCWPHHELSRSAPDAETGKRSWEARTPAMASGLTDHMWSAFELMSYKVAPSPWTAPKRRRRPRTRLTPESDRPKRPRGRPRKVASCTSTS